MTFVSLLLEDDVSIAKYACLVLPDLLSILLKLLCIVCVCVCDKGAGSENKRSTKNITCARSAVFCLVTQAEMVRV